MANITAPYITLRSQTGLQIQFDVTVPTEAAYDHTVIRYGEILEEEMTFASSSAENSSDIVTITGLTAGVFYMFVPVAIDSAGDVISYPGNTVIATVAPNIVLMSTLEADSCALAEIHRQIARRVTVDAVADYLAAVREYMTRAGLADVRVQTEMRRMEAQIGALHKTVLDLG